MFHSEDFFIKFCVLARSTFFFPAGLVRDPQPPRHREDGGRGKSVRQHVPAAAGPLGGDVWRPPHLPATGASRRLLQGHREAGGLPGVDHRDRRERKPYGTHHRQTASDRGAREGVREWFPEYFV